MSNIILGKVWELKLGDPTRKVVAICLADAANHEGYCWYSLKQIAALCEIHPDSARRHIRALEESAIIEREDRYQKGRQTSNGYTFKRATLDAMLGLHDCKGEGGMGASLPPCMDATPILEPSEGTIKGTSTGAGDLFGILPQPKPIKAKLSSDDKLAAATIRTANVCALLAAYPKPPNVLHSAERIISAKLRKYSFETLLAAVKAYAAEKAGTELRFVKAPENYFRDDCFLIAPSPGNLPVNGNNRAPLAPVMSAAQRRAEDTGRATK